MDEKQDKEVKLLVYFLIIAIIALFSYFLIYPTLNKVKTTQGDFAQYNKLLKEKEETLQAFNELAATYKKQKSYFQKIDQAMLGKTNDKILLLVQFEVLASKSNMTMESFSFGELASGGSELGVLPVTLSVKGKYSDFKNCLDAISQNLPLMEVENIQFSPSAEASSLYTFMLEVNVYSEEAPQSQSQDQATGGESQSSNTSTSPSPATTSSPTTSPSPTSPTTTTGQ